MLSCTLPRRARKHPFSFSNASEMEKLPCMFADSWTKTKGACRYPNGQFHSIANTAVCNQDECKAFCTKNPNCDAFDTDGNKCFLFRDQGALKHIGDGKHADFCYRRAGETPILLRQSYLELHPPPVQILCSHAVPMLH